VVPADPRNNCGEDHGGKPIRIFLGRACRNKFGALVVCPMLNVIYVQKAVFN